MNIVLWILTSWVVCCDIAPVALASCPGGWVQSPTSCYLMELEEKATQSRADEICVKHGGRLVSIEDQEENEFILQHTRSKCAPHGCEMSIWIGLINRDPNKTKSSWEWMDGAALTWDNWFHGEPSGGIRCGRMRIIDVNTGKWGDIECDKKFPFVCKKSFGSNKMEELLKITVPSVGVPAITLSAVAALVKKFWWKNKSCVKGALDIEEGEAAETNNNAKSNANPDTANNSKPENAPQPKPCHVTNNKPSPATNNKPPAVANNKPSPATNHKPVDKAQTGAVPKTRPAQTRKPRPVPVHMEAIDETGPTSKDKKRDKKRYDLPFTITIQGLQAPAGKYRAIRK